MRRFATPTVFAAALATVCMALVASVALQHQQQAERRAARLAFKGPESPAQLMQAKNVRAAKVGVVEPGAMSAVLQQKARIAGKADIPGAAGEWREYGVGNLDDSSGAFQAARVDNFSYDAENKRLFASVGTGGVWMSEAVDGDVTTIGNAWRSIGDNLPTQIIGGVAWTPAGGGTVVAAGGEGVMGSGMYNGFGAFWTNDMGATWTQSTGFPDATIVFRVQVDQSRPELVYIASGKGLFRSEDAGRSFTNVRLPTAPGCEGVEDLTGPCLFANMVTDVVVKVPGGSTNAVCDAAGCPVLAGVGYRTGSAQLFQDGVTVQGSGNGLYRSNTGEVDSFGKLDVSAASNLLPIGFTEQDRIGRIEMNVAFGPDQDHNYIYAMVQDAVLFNGGVTGEPTLDAILGVALLLGFPSTFNGIYVSSDFGDSWVRMADTIEVIVPITGSEIALIGAALGSGAGIQSWYNMWLAIDPTRDVGGIPTRMAFGLEEVWQNRTPSTTAAGVPLNGIAQAGPSDFHVIGTYFNLTGIFPSTTHPDQQGGIYVATDDGGVCLFVGNDGGIFKQCVAANGIMNNFGWGEGANTGMYTMLPYGLGVAKDGTVYFGNQDNGSGLLDPARDFKLFQTNGGDGFYAEVDPDNSDVAYYETQNGGLVRTTNRGGSNTSIAPTYTRVMFDNWFRMDPLNAQHMVTGAQEIYETDNAQTVTGDSWVEVFNLGTNPETGAIRTTTTMEVQGSAVYVGGCGDCGASGNDTGFASVLATNVTEGVERVAETDAGWRFAEKRGLPSRYITSIAIDPVDPKIVYVALGGYLSGLRPPGSFLDVNAGNIGSGAVFKSVNAGDDFVDVTGDLPVAQVASIIIKGDQLLAGTDIGVFISKDATGASWTTLGTGLPAVPVNMIRIKPKATADEPDMLFAATFGRSIWNYAFKDGSVVTPPVITPTPTVPGATTGRFGGSLGGAALLGLLAMAALRRRRH
ncbi:MAG: hypothetical protein Q7J29_10455 [Stagnimonas sp.]|nr:hypothetical protein [Stagnimonas sp.]